METLFFSTSPLGGDLQLCDLTCGDMDSTPLAGVGAGTTIESPAAWDCSAINTPSFIVMGNSNNSHDPILSTGSDETRFVESGLDREPSPSTVYYRHHHTPAASALDAAIAHPRDRRLHQAFKALSKTERQLMVQRDAEDSDLLERTVHLRFLPTGMQQGELAAMCAECGPFLRVRICGNSTDSQNWIYGFVEFERKSAAEAMMQMNGRELANGHGKPQLRLKCHKANQPIVDRVFHDADPASNSPCIFGQGSFASRTLKDALDSYFNLKAKEKQAEESKSGVTTTTTPSSNSSTSSYAEHNAFLIKATATPPSSTPLSVGSTLLDHSTTVSATKLRADAKVFVPTFIPSSSTTTAAEAPSNPAADALLPDALLPTLRRVAPVYVPSGAAAPPVADVEAEGIYPILPASPSPFPTAVQRGADILLCQTMEAMEANTLAVNSEEVISGCCALVLDVLECSLRMSTKQQFLQAVGRLEEVLQRLKTYEVLTGNGLNTTNGDYTSEVPQKATQLRLLANLLLVLLHMSKRSVKDAMPFIHNLICCVLEVPQVAPVQPNTENGEDEDEESGAVYRRDVRFHRFVLHALLCAGMAVEEVMPGESSKLYASALQRADQTLLCTSDVVQQNMTLPRMRKEVMGGCAVLDITSFPNFFFQSCMTFVRQAREFSDDFWIYLPPSHILEFFG